MRAAAIVVAFAMLTFCQAASAGGLGRNACTEDMLKLCGTIGDRSQRIACLKSNWTKLSPDCRTLLKGN